MHYFRQTWLLAVLGLACGGKDETSATDGSDTGAASSTSSASDASATTQAPTTTGASSSGESSSGGSSGERRTGGPVRGCDPPPERRREGEARRQRRHPRQRSALPDEPLPRPRRQLRQRLHLDQQRQKHLRLGHRPHRRVLGLLRAELLRHQQHRPVPQTRHHRPQAATHAESHRPRHPRDRLHQNRRHLRQHRWQNLPRSRPTRLPPRQIHPRLHHLPRHRGEIPPPHLPRPPRAAGGQLPEHVCLHDGGGGVSGKVRNAAGNDAYHVLNSVNESLRGHRPIHCRSSRRGEAPGLSTIPESGEAGC